jgi:hypothetical protein
MTQCEQVLEYIKENGSIDAWRAMHDLHIMRLASRIHELKEAGVPIIGIMQSRVAYDGSVVRWKEYYIDSNSRRTVGA